MKKIPKFKNKEEERKFWGKADSVDFVDWSKAEKNPNFVINQPLNYPKHT